MKRKIDNETIVEGAPNKTVKTVTWAEGTKAGNDIATEVERDHSSLAVSREREESKFKQVKDALRKKDIASATSILRSLSTEEARDVLHKNDGQVVIDIIKLAHREMKHHRYNTVEFRDLYSILIDLDEDYFSKRVDKACSQITDKTFHQMDIDIYNVSRHIGKVSLEKAALKASSGEVASISTIDKEEKISFDQIKQALRENKIKEATRILQSLSKEEANDIIHQEDGKIIIWTIKVAHNRMKKYRYDKEEFVKLYECLIDLDLKYVKDKAFQAGTQIIEKSTERVNTKVLVLFDHMSEINAKKEALKASSTEVASTSAIDKEDETPLDQVKKALAKDMDDMSEAAKILRSISREEAYNIIHHDDGYVVARAIRLTYHNLRKHKDDSEASKADLEAFKTLYTALHDIAPEYTQEKTFSTNGQIIDSSSKTHLPELHTIARCIGDVKSARASSEEKDGRADTEKDSTVPDDSFASVADAPCERDTGQTKSDDNTKLSPDLESSGFINFVITKDIGNAQNNKSTNSFGYIMNFFFGWLNALPSFIQESIKEGSAFQVFLANYKELQSMLTVNQNEIILPSAEESIDKTKSVNDIDLEQRAHIIYDQNSPFIGIDSMLSPSVLATLPITMISGSDNCELLGAEKAYDIDYQIPIFK